MLAKNYLDSLNLDYQQKSNLKDLSAWTQDILIGDTMGEIELYFALCDLVFMGGSLNNTGGHNPLEPAFFGIPCLTGPVYHNFKDIYESFFKAEAALKIKDPEDLASTICKLINDPKLLLKMGALAQQLQREGQGSLKRDLEIIKSYL